MRGCCIFDHAEDVQFLYFALIVSGFIVQSSCNPAGSKQVLVLAFCGPTCILQRHRHPSEEKMVPNGTWLLPNIKKRFAQSI